MRRGRGQRGQSSVEYALVLLAFLAIAIALCALWHAAHEGRLLGIARDHASHNSDDAVGFLQDVEAY